MSNDWYKFHDCFCYNPAMADKLIEQNIQVRIPDNIASGVYANVVNISASPNEVVLDFILHVPNQPQAILSSRIIISKETAQQVSDLLEVLLRKTFDKDTTVKEARMEYQK